MEAIILAGGRGTRLGAMTAAMPKPMLAVDGRPFLEYLMAYWAGQGVRRFIISSGYQHEKISGHFGARFKTSEVVISVEEKPLGTGGGVLLALSRLESTGAFLCLNGDTFFEVDLKRLAEVHGGRKAEATLSLFHRGEGERYEGVSLAEDGRIEDWLSRGSGKPLYANGGVYLFEREIFHGLPPETFLSLENDILPAWIRGGRKIFGAVSAGGFLDIGTPADYARAGDFFKQQSS